MGSKVHPVHHLEADELHQLYKAATDATERTLGAVRGRGDVVHAALG